MKAIKFKEWIEKRCPSIVRRSWPLLTQKDEEQLKNQSCDVKRKQNRH